MFLFYDLHGISVGVSDGVGVSVGVSVGVGVGVGDGVSVVAFNWCDTFFILSNRLLILMAVLFWGQRGRVAFVAFWRGHGGWIGRT